MLGKIVADKRREVAARKEALPVNRMLNVIRQGSFAFGKALRSSEWSLIAECKLASPAKGRLCNTHTVPELAQVFTQNGASALSVHTSTHFCGDLYDIARVRGMSELPILRKDFIIDEYQIYEARWASADAILLIAAILSDDEIHQFLARAHELGMDCLVEVHSLEELLRVQNTPAEFVGINNRNLQTFTTDINNTFALLPNCDQRRIIISESGISTQDEVRRLQQAGVRGILVGEGLVKAQDIASRTRELASSVRI